MPKYIISAEEPGGSKTTEEFEAASAGEAVRDLRARGYTNVKLETEDIIAIVNQGFEELTNVHPVDRFVTPKDYVTFSKLPGWRRWFFSPAKRRSKNQMSAASWAFYLSVGIAITLYWEVRSRLRGAMNGVDAVVFAIVGIIFFGPVLYALFLARTGVSIN